MPHLLPGFIPDIGLTILVAPPLLNPLKFLSTLAVAASQGRALLPPIATSHAMRHFARREEDPADAAPVPRRAVHLATNQIPRFSELWLADPNTALPRYRPKPHWCTAPPHPDESAIKFINRLREYFPTATTEPSQLPPEFDAPNSPPALSPEESGSLPPLVLIDALLPHPTTTPGRHAAWLAQLTTALDIFAQKRNLPIVAILTTPIAPRAIASAVNFALTLPGVASLISLTPHRSDSEKVVLTPHAHMLCMADPCTLYAPLMEPLVSSDAAAGANNNSPSHASNRPAAPDHFTQLFTAPARSAIDEATTWLTTLLRAGPIPIAATIKSAQAQGISRATLFRARHALGLITTTPPDKSTDPTWTSPPPPRTATTDLIASAALAAASASSSAATPPPTPAPSSPSIPSPPPPAAPTSPPAPPPTPPAPPHSSPAAPAAAPDPLLPIAHCLMPSPR